MQKELPNDAVEMTVRRQVRQNTVIPVKTGIQRSGVNLLRLDSGLRRNDEKIELVDGPAVKR